MSSILIQIENIRKIEKQHLILYIYLQKLKIKHFLRTEIYEISN